MKYEMRAKVDQIVTKEVQLLVIASSEEEAEEKAREALSEYPGPVSVSGIERVSTVKTHYWTPRSIEFFPVREDESF